MPTITSLVSRTSRNASRNAVLVRRRAHASGSPLIRLLNTHAQRPSPHHHHLSRRMPGDDNKGSGPLSRVAALSRQLFPSSPFSTKATGDRDSDAGQLLGHLKIGPDVQLPVFEPHDPLRLPMQRLLLNMEDPNVLGDLTWMGKKWQLGQDIL